MSEQKWTPGPWEAFHSTSGNFTVAGPVRGGDGPYLDGSDANAFLIAAAPELYEALEGLAAAASIQVGAAGGALDHVFAVHLRGARAALAKARGEQA